MKSQTEGKQINKCEIDYGEGMVIEDPAFDGRKLAMTTKTSEGKGIKETLYFISELGIDYERFLIDNDFTREQVIWVWKKETLIGRRLEEEQIYKGRGWYKVCSQDFINSRII